MKKLLSVFTVIALVVTMVGTLSFSTSSEELCSLGSMVSRSLLGAGDNQMKGYYDGEYSLGSATAGEVSTVTVPGATTVNIHSEGNVYFYFSIYDVDGSLVDEGDYGDFDMDTLLVETNDTPGTATIILAVYYGTVEFTYFGNTPSLTAQSGGKKLDYLVKSNFYPTNTVNLSVGETMQYQLVDSQPGYYADYFSYEGEPLFSFDDETVAIVDTYGNITAVGEGTTTVYAYYWFGQSEYDCSVFRDELTVVVGDGGNTPVYTEPAYTEPAYTQPAYTEPVYTQPVYTQPVETQPATPSSVLYGDANMDSVVNMKDVLTMRKYVAGLSVDIDLISADTNVDSLVNMKDVLTVRKYVAGLIPYIDGGGNGQPVYTQPVATQPVYTQPVYTQPGTSSGKTKTVMIYLVGSNLESEGGAASSDIVEMMNSGVDTNANNVLIYTGGAQQWYLQGIPADQNCIYRLEDDGFALVESYNAMNMGDSETLAGFLRFGVQNYTADEYGLVLWNHGAGPLLGYGIDENFGDLLEMSELEDALASGGFGNGNKLEFLGFDACLMGSIETAWAVKDYANYLIASQEVEPGWGWDYSFLKQLDTYDSGKDIGTAIVDAYINTSNEMAVYRPQLESDVTLSCLDLSKLDAVEQCLDALFSKVDGNLITGYFPKASRCRSNTKAFGKFASGYEYDLIDIGHIVSLLAEDYAAESGALEAALDEFVCYSKSNVENASGVSIYHPYDNVEYMAVWITEFQALGFADAYARYITDFAAMLLTGGESFWDNFNSSKSTAEKKDNGHELSVQLTPEQAANYAYSNYYILKKMEDGDYLFIFSGIDAELDENGVLSATYNDKAVFAVDEAMQEISEMPITMFQVRDGSDELKYFAPALFSLNEGDIEDWTIDAVEWQIKIEDGQPKPLGAFLIEDVNGPEIPQKQLLDYQDYTYVTFAFSTRMLKTDDAGHTLPYFDWDATGTFYGTEFEVSHGLHLECREIDDKEDYYVMFAVEDVQGNVYTTDLFQLPD